MPGLGSWDEGVWLGRRAPEGFTIKIRWRFPVYFTYFLSGWNDKFLTPPSQTLIAHDIHNYNELKRK